MESMATLIMYSNLWWKRKKNRNPIKENNRHISEELIEYILIPLPVKSLVRFKSVCKTWRSLIQSLSFIDEHRRFHSGDYFNQLIVSPSTSHPITSSSSSSDDFIEVVPGPLDDLTLPSEMMQLDDDSDSEWRSVVRTLGPLSNGIYCLIVNRHKKFGRISVSSSKIAVCNPATREFKFTNPFPVKSRSLLSELAQKPSRVHYGFGTVPKKSSGLDYKIVVVISWGTRYTSFLSFVYSMQRGTWKKVVDFEDGRRDRSERKAVCGLTIDGMVHYPEISQDLELCPQRFFKGCWHWMAAVEFDDMYNVLSFNVATNAFKLIIGPPGYYDNHPTQLYVKGGVLVLIDYLAAIYVSQPSFLVGLHLVESPCVTIDVWLMMEYGVQESWSHVYTINPCMHQRISRFVGLTAVPKEDYDEDRCDYMAIILLEDDNKQLISCDEFGFKEHGIYNISSSICWNNLGISTYRGTLDSL